MLGGGCSFDNSSVKFCRIETKNMKKVILAVNSPRQTRLPTNNSTLACKITRTIKLVRGMHWTTHRSRKAWFYPSLPIRSCHLRIFEVGKSRGHSTCLGCDEAHIGWWQPWNPKHKQIVNKYGSGRGCWRHSVSAVLERIQKIHLGNHSTPLKFYIPEWTSRRCGDGRGEA